MNNADDQSVSGADELEPSEAESKDDAQVWLDIITDAEKVFKDWQSRADNIDKLYADLSRLANNARDREFQLFWANVEVLKPAIYARPPIPVVTPKFKDRRPLYRAASELLERCCIVTFDMTDINSVMELVRDDVAVVGRGVPWLRYETKAESDTNVERVAIEHKDRDDFIHEPARKWQEVGWVSGASYLTQKGMKKRFKEHSGDEYLNAAYYVRKDKEDRYGFDSRARAKVWEIWSKSENRVVWVAEGCRKVLDQGAPHLKLENFFPCPKPAYATVQRRSLIPVPDMVFYKDQLEEINELTGRIHALAEAIQVRGFYPAGASDVADAIEAAIKKVDNRQVLIGVANWAAFGGTAPKDTIVWLPIDQIVTTIQSLVELRRQIIEDVYQIMGLSDIMRGATDPKETLGAQQLKSQYGSVRVKGKQSELVRVARDVVRIAAEIMAENFSKSTLRDMSQSDLPTNADIEKQVKDLEGQETQIALKAKQDIQANPQAEHQVIQQAEEAVGGLRQQIEKLKAQPTLEDVLDFLKDQKIRPFVLDIETDSTIQPDEDAEKQRRGEFMQAVGTVLPQLGQMIAAEPASAPFAGELLKFATAPFRIGRGMEGAIDEFVDAMKAKAGQPRPNPEAEQAKAEAEREDKRLQFDMQKAEGDRQAKAQEVQAKALSDQKKAEMEMQQAQLDAQLKQRESDAKLAQIDAQMRRDEQKGILEMQKLREELNIKRQAAEIDMASQAQQAEFQATQASQQFDQNEREFEQKAELNEQQARLASQRAHQQNRPEAGV